MKNHAPHSSIVCAPERKPSATTPSGLKGFLSEKRLHFKYLTGKALFRINYYRRPEYLRQKKLHLRYILGMFLFRLRWQSSAYIRQKKLHLRYLVGKIAFQAHYWAAPRYLREKKLHLKYLNGKFAFYLAYWNKALRTRSFYVQQIHDWSLKCHGMELGILRQYEPRPVRSSPLPVCRRKKIDLPSIAIVTPSYNQGHLIAQTIESVLGQDYPHLQYAVVDGGSNDETTTVMERYRELLAYQVSEPDGGQSHAIVKGFGHLHGEIMAYLNSDDLLLEGSLHYVGAFFATHPDVDVIYGHRIVIDEAGQEVGRWFLPRHDPYAIRHFDYVPQETLFWRRSLYEAVGGICPSFQFAMDWDLLLRFMASGARFYRAPHFMACFRIHIQQKTHVLLNSVGEQEKTRLLAREHPEGYCWRRTEDIKNSYRMRSSLCGALLKYGIRY